MRLHSFKLIPYLLFLILHTAFLLFSHAHAALPQALAENLNKIGIKEENIAIVIMDTDPKGKTWIMHNEKTMMNPASVMKLVTTYAALDILGPNYTWSTAAFIDGKVSNHTLDGSLYIRGSGDPAMTIDRMRELLKQIRAAGIYAIKGDLLIDPSTYDIPTLDPAAFDGEPLRPYNVRPDSLLVNFKTVTFSFNPLLAKPGDRIPILMNPSMAGVEHNLEIPVSNQRCGDWQKNLQADFTNPLNIRFNGHFPLNCGPKQWYVAYPDPQNHALRTIGALWQELGGEIKGKVSYGTVPTNAQLVAFSESKPLAEIVRDINKYSNNVMAQSVFLALSLPDQKSFLQPSPIHAPATYESSRTIIAQWWQKKFSQTTAPVMENGSGLSRFESISAQSLAVMLEHAWNSPVMPEFMSSLPIASIDGTMRRSKAVASAHIKTGSIRNVTTRAGYVLGSNAQRRIFVFMINSNKAHEVGEAIDILIDWAA
ncbi:MAG: D-alanyl-D-alanine carboxypeptidase/D-alanyl-D-alanine endopeptidase, partial [Saezia sp.]